MGGGFQGAEELRHREAVHAAGAVGILAATRRDGGQHGRQFGIGVGDEMAQGELALLLGDERERDDPGILDLDEIADMSVLADACAGA